MPKSWPKLKCQYCKSPISYKKRRSLCCSDCRWKHLRRHRGAMYISRYLISIKELRGKPSKCELCNTVEDLQLHHINYDKPDLIEWLCPGCHTYRHEQIARKSY